MTRAEYERAMRGIRRFLANDYRRGCDPYNSLFGHRRYGKVRK